jgi:hypothetical protein
MFWALEAALVLSAGCFDRSASQGLSRLNGLIIVHPVSLGFHICQFLACCFF